MLANEEKELCLFIARNIINFNLGLNKELVKCPPNEIFQNRYGLFVSIHKNNQLRGCIGYIKPYKKLYESLIDLAYSAAFRDSRFKQVEAFEVESILIEISILSPLSVISDIDDIEIGRHGLYIQHPYGSGLLLPQVATKNNWNKKTFLEETYRKAGISKEDLKNKQAKIYSFEAEIFDESTIKNS